MSIFQKVTLEILKKNKTRTIVTIIGIILSASMFTAVTSSVSSLQNYMVSNAIYNEGDWHISALETDETIFDFLKDPESVLTDPKEQSYFSEGEVESYVYSQQIGYAIAEGCTNAYKPYLYIIGADSNFCEKMPVHLTGGRLPKDGSEILLPEHLAENGEVHYKVGDVLTLEIGNRMSDGYVLGQHNPYMNGDEGEPVEGSAIAENNDREYLEVTETRTFTVVGFYERPGFENYSAPGYTAITVPDKVRTEGSLYNVYFKMENLNDVMNWFNHITFFGSELNTNVLTYQGVSGYPSFYFVLYGLAAVIIGLIMFGSVSLIYNAFSISVSERTKQFGLLSSIGATKKQLRQMVLFEAVFVSAIGIPLGILAGVGGMGVTFYFIGKEFSSLTDYAIPLTLHIYPISLVASCVITLATVLISAWIPSKRATMVTAVEAIRQSGDVKLGRREKKRMNDVKSHAYTEQPLEIQAVGSMNSEYMENFHTSGTTFGERFIYRFFGLPGMIADKYYKRSKRKYRATIISLFMSIVLFVSASAFTTYLTDMVEAGYEGNGYDISYHYDPSEYMTKEQILNEEYDGVLSQAEVSEILQSAESVTEAMYVDVDMRWMNISYEFLSEEYIAYQKEYFASLEMTNTEEAADILFAAAFVEDAVYEEFLKENNLQKDLYVNEEAPLGVAIEGNSFFDYQLQKYITAKVLKSADTEIVFDEETGVTLKCGTILYERPYFVSDIYHLTFVYPYSMKEVVMQGTTQSSMGCEHYLLSDDHATSYVSIKNILTENGLSKQRLYDMAEAMEENRTLIMIINVFAYGFIVLISLIAAANVFNTITTNINLRRREFAMLKSVGMSQKEMNRMMNFECILYGSRALCYGIPVAMGITWIIYRIVSEGYTAGFYLPWGAIGIAVCSVFLVVFAAMMYSMKKIKADNPIDALKNENL